jgi:hypothetical protein
MKPKARKLNLEKTKALHLVKNGVSVHVRVDEDGRPLIRSAGCWLGGDEERITTLALENVGLLLNRAADLKDQAEAAEVRKANSHEAAKESAKVRAELAAEHWSYEFLAQAYEPNIGWSRLRTAARKRAAAAGITPEKRDEISEHYAREFRRKARTK